LTSPALLGECFALRWGKSTEEGDVTEEFGDSTPAGGGGLHAGPV